jgi:hypothetical protein
VKEGFQCQNPYLACSNGGEEAPAAAEKAGRLFRSSSRREKVGYGKL